MLRQQFKDFFGEIQEQTLVALFYEEGLKIPHAHDQVLGTNGWAQDKQQNNSGAFKPVGQRGSNGKHIPKN